MYSLISKSPCFDMLPGSVVQNNPAAINFHLIRFLSPNIKVKITDVCSRKNTTRLLSTDKLLFSCWKYSMCCRTIKMNLCVCVCVCVRVCVLSYIHQKTLKIHFCEWFQMIHFVRWLIYILSKIQNRSSDVGIDLYRWFYLVN